jgi:hypothetical protein
VLGPPHHAHPALADGGDQLVLLADDATAFQRGEYT